MLAAPVPGSETGSEQRVVSVATVAPAPRKRRLNPKVAAE